MHSAFLTHNLYRGYTLKFNADRIQSSVVAKKDKTRAA